jgi:hypothetical protein
MSSGGRSGMMGGRAGAGMAGAAPNGGKGATGGAGASGGAAAGGAGANGGMSGSGEYQPVCDGSVVKGASCNTSSVHFCYRTCGPDSVGFKSETCQGGAYVEGNCQFPASGDYSCYSIPNRLPSECPGTVPRAAEACDVPLCTPCFGGTMMNPQYQDSSGSQKTGYCVCNDAGVWTCATSTDPSSWPCPGNTGCN